MTTRDALFWIVGFNVGMLEARLLASWGRRGRKPCPVRWDKRQGAWVRPGGYDTTQADLNG